LCIGVPVGSQQPATGVALVPVADDGAAVDICVAWRKTESSPAVLQFLDCMREVFPLHSHEPSAAATTSSRRVS
jgi:hypothetical protein